MSSFNKDAKDFQNKEDTYVENIEPKDIDNKDDSRKLDIWRNLCTRSPPT